MKHLKKIIILLYLVFCFPTNVWSDTAIYTISGSQKPGIVQLGIMRNNESMEIEFKLISKNYKDPDPEDNSEIVLAVRQKPIKTDGRIILKNVSGRWCLFYYPPGSESYARKYYIYIPINEDGLNRIRIDRKNDWVSYYFNKKFIGGIPLKPGDVTSLISVYNLEIDYRWVTQKFNKASAKNPLETAKAEFGNAKTKKSEMSTSSAKSDYIYVPGGHYRIIDTLHNLKDGETLRLSINVRNVLKDPRWANSISIIIDKSQVWLKEAWGTYIIDFETASGIAEKLSDRINLDKKKNIIDIKRNKETITLIVNGKKIGSYNHSQAFELTDDYHVSLKFVGMEVEYSYKIVTKK